MQSSSDEEFRANAEVVCQFADVRHGQISIAPENHGPEVPAPTQEPRQIGSRHPGFVEQMSQSGSHPHLGPTKVRPIVVLEQSAEQVEVISLIGREVLLS